MTDQALSTLPREAKGPLAPPPTLDGPIKAVVDAIAAWPEVEATTHWHLRDRNRIDGIDLYVGPDELGHIHLDGSIHLATTPELGAKLVAEGLGRPFPWAQGWTMTSVSRLGVDAAVALFRRNYDRLRPSAIS
ncbi:luciferase family protein [Lichenicoccus sp.]|uniref:luciferase domain-containing protein n=1 Tax=Lichenicoccus sp. TaxID=2781899 RepID=UPI003D0FAB4C